MDVLLLSGGVSMGKADFVPAVLTRLGVERVFHQTASALANPCGSNGATGQAVFASAREPGVDAGLLRRYVLPALARMAGLPAPPPQFAVLAQPASLLPRLTWFLPPSAPVQQDNCWRCRAPTNTSGDFASLTGTDRFIELAADSSPNFPAGPVAPLHRWQFSSAPATIEEAGM